MVQNLHTKESTPEKYLREIRDLQQQNLKLLKKLTKYEELKNSREKLSVFIKIFGIVLPYILSIALVWGFYIKIESLTSSVINTVKNIPKNINIDISKKWKDVSHSFSDKTKDIKDTIFNKWEN